MVQDYKLRLLPRLILLNDSGTLGTGRPSPCDTGRTAKGMFGYFSPNCVLCHAFQIGGSYKSNNAEIISGFSLNHWNCKRHSVHFITEACRGPQSHLFFTIYCASNATYVWRSAFV